MTYNIGPNEWNIDGTKYAPGDILNLTGGTRYEIEFHNLRGTAGKPITVTASNPLTIRATNLNGGNRVVQYYNSAFIDFTGGQDMKIDITGGGQGVDFRDCSTDCRVQYINFHDIGYSAVNMKTDPTCDPKTWRGNFVLRNPVVNNCRFYNIKTGEAIYIGESHWHTQLDRSCNGSTIKVKEHEVTGALVYNNTFENIGRDCVQIGGCPTGAKIYGNTLKNFGTTKEYGQGAGLQANPGTVAEIYDNYIETGSNFGVILQGPGGSIVRNNVIVNTGGTSDGGGIMTAQYIPNGKTDVIRNNTLINITRYGLQYFSPVELSDNIINMKSGFSVLNKGGSAGTILDSGNVKLVGDPTPLKLDANYFPLVGSPAYGETSDKGARQSVKPPKVVIEPANVTVESTGNLISIFVTTPSGKRFIIDQVRN